MSLFWLDLSILTQQKKHRRWRQSILSILCFELVTQALPGYTAHTQG